MTKQSYHNHLSYQRAIIIFFPIHVLLQITYNIYNALTLLEPIFGTVYPSYGPIIFADDSKILS